MNLPGMRHSIHASLCILWAVNTRLLTIINKPSAYCVFGQE